jgi:hypothetical protein
MMKAKDDKLATLEQVHLGATCSVLAQLGKVGAAHSASAKATLEANQCDISTSATACGRGSSNGPAVSNEFVFLVLV